MSADADASINPNVIPGLGERIAIKRKAIGLSQQQLAAALGITQGAVGHIESERRAMPVHVLVGIAAALGCDVNDLIPEKYIKEIQKKMTQSIDR